MGANQQTHSSLGHGSKASTSKLAPPTRPAESHQPAPPGSVDESARLVPIFKVLLGMTQNPAVSEALVGLGAVEALLATLQQMVLEPLLQWARRHAGPQHPRPLAQAKLDGLRLTLDVFQQCGACKAGLRALAQERLPYTLMAEVNLQPRALLPQPVAQLLLDFCEKLQARCTDCGAAVDRVAAKPAE